MCGRGQNPCRTRQPEAETPGPGSSQQGQSATPRERCKQCRETLHPPAHPPPSPPLTTVDMMNEHRKDTNLMGGSSRGGRLNQKMLLASVLALGQHAQQGRGEWGERRLEGGTGRAACALALGGHWRLPGHGLPMHARNSSSHHPECGWLKQSPPAQCCLPLLCFPDATESHIKV